MSTEFSPELRKELLDDFYAECDEHLAAVRQQLEQLEELAGRGEPVAPAVDRLARSLHSLKGISAIAGVQPAEQLAHRMEDLLRSGAKQADSWIGSRVDLLLGATQRLEQIVAAHRLGKPLPSNDEWLSQLSAASGGPVLPSAAREEPAAASPSATDPMRLAEERGLTLWRCSFAPTPELDRRGVNVSAVRERLAALGETFSAVPQVRPDGSIEFVFMIGLREEPGELAAWADDAIRLERAVAEPAEKFPDGVVEAPVEAGITDTLSLTPSHIVRVDLGRLDELMRIAGELVIHRSRLDDRISQVAGERSGLKEVNLALARSLRELRSAIARVRLVPIGELLTRMPYVVRDLGRGSDKKAQVVLEGRQTEVDKFIVERLKEPLLHLVRNAFTHGLESAAERRALGKPEEGTIALSATSSGDSVLIRVRDDGRGIDAGAVKARAEMLGLSVPENIDAAGLLRVLCEPGFSTREQADRAAGRGVGMDVVATTVRELGGAMTLETVRNRGTEFSLRLPLTLSIVDAIIVAVGKELCAVPQSSVHEIVQLPAGGVRRIQKAEIVPYRDGVLPFMRLRAMFGLEPQAGNTMTLLVLSSERGATGLLVDGVRGQREIVVRPLSDPLLRVPGISGATELGDGRPILILDPIALTNGAVRPVMDAEGLAAPKPA